MLLKLIKYEFKSTGTAFLAAIGVYAVMVAVLLTFFSGYPGLVMSLSVAGLFALWVMMFIMIIFQRYNGNLYGSEGYLMLTLPVSSRKLLFSKLFTACVWFVALSILSAVAGLLMLTRLGDIRMDNEVYSAVFDHIYECVLLLIQFADSVISGIIAVYFAITISKLPIWRRLGVLVGIISYFVLSTLHSVPSLFFGTAHTADPSTSFASFLFLSGVTEINTFKYWTQIGYDAALCVGLFFLIAWLIDKKTNLA